MKLREYLAEKYYYGDLKKSPTMYCKKKHAFAE